MEIPNENLPTKESLFGRSTTAGNLSGSLPKGPASENSEYHEKTQVFERSRSSLGFEYEAQVQVIKQKHGDLEAIRHRLGLSKRKISQILMVDPSAWTRWTKQGEDAPPHIYRSLEWYLLIQNKYPGMDSPFWLEAVARPGNLKAETAALRKEFIERSERIEQETQILNQSLNEKLSDPSAKQFAAQLSRFQRKLRWTQVGLASTIALSSLIIVLLSCSSPQITPNFVANSKLHEVPVPDKEFRDLAAQFAPIFMQEVGTDPRGDLFTSVDYDNDWVANNNWANMEKFEEPPSVYFEVVSTATHYFITYGVFHPRDYSWVCMPIVCHENDMEGVMVVVDRATMKWTYSESIAHNYVFSQENTRGSDRPTLIIEWGGHGIYPPSQYNTTRMTKIFNPQIYGLEPIAKLWNAQFSESKLYEGTFDYEGERFRLSGVPKAFLGRKWTDDRANPPWAWPDFAQGKRGDLFFDPATYISQKHPGTRMSLDYERHPYILKL